MLARHMTIAAVLLALFAVGGTALVALTHDATAERIEQAERAALAQTLHTLIGPGEHDNDLQRDAIAVTAPQALGTAEPVTVYRARRAGQPVGVVMPVVAPDGYSGAIKLLVGIHYDGCLAGVRVIAHRETPGLGDYIEADRSKWILGFNGRSLLNPGAKGWAVKKDGGAFDYVTGATITPRAIVKAVHKTLLYYSENVDQLFAAPQSQETRP